MFALVRDSFRSLRSSSVSFAGAAHPSAAPYPSARPRKQKTKKTKSHPNSHLNSSYRHAHISHRRSEKDSQLRAPVELDLVLLSVTLLLVGFGMIILYSTTGIISQEQFGDALFYLRKQLLAAAIGIAALIVAIRLPVSLLRAVSPYCFFICLSLMALPLLPGVGVEAGGASRWISISSFRFQPGELVKLLTIVFLAGYFARHENRVQKFVPGLVVPMGIVGVISVLFLMQPDFGSVAMIVSVALIMAFAAGAKITHLLFVGFGALCSFAALVAFSPYRMRRILSFLDPESDASGQGYQLMQSLIAVGSGELTGVGLGGSQQKLFFLPAAHTDFIFAVVAEELGFIGCVLLLTMFFVFLWRGIRIAKKVSHSTFHFTLALGLTMLIVAPALLNLGVVTGLLPTKGMVLPLISYGGTSLIVCLLSIGLLLSLTRKPTS